MAGPVQTALVGLTAVVAVVAAATIWILARRARVARREQYIRSYTFPPGLLDRLAKARPQLAFKDVALTSHALRHFFLAYLRARGQFVAMPSQLADDLWHEFILYTKNYEVFCRHAFGRFLHHAPAAVLGPHRPINVGLRRVWWWCCREENIDPRRPSRLPLLFALDAKMRIADGFHYAADCSEARSPGDGRRGSASYCGTSFSNGDVDGSIDGFGCGSGDGGAFDLGASLDGGSADAGCGSGCGGGGGGGD